MASRILIVPAAGAGSRLGASQPKPLVSVAGKPMIERVVDLYVPHVQRVVVVVSPSAADAIEVWRGGREHIALVQQASPTGMLDAILLAADAVVRIAPREIWISWADQVGVLPATLGRLSAATAAVPRPALVLPTVLRADPYTHFERDGGGRIVRLLQRREGDRMPAEGESDMGVFALDAGTFARELPEYARGVPRGAGTGERNFLPFVPWLAARRPVVTIPCTDVMEAIGVNTPAELRVMERWLETR